MKKIILLFVFFVIFSSSYSQQKYWIFFKDKGDTSQVLSSLLSNQCVDNRVKFNIPLRQFTDFSINCNYKKAIQNLGIKLRTSSKWLNAISVEMSVEQKEIVQKLSFVRSVDGFGNRLIVSSKTPIKTEKKYATPIDMMKAEAFVKAGLNGKGVKVGVIDAGYENADRDSNLVHLFVNKNIVLTRDFLNKKRDTSFYIAQTKSDFHGTEVLVNLSGSNNSKRIQSGLATNAQLYLARTEDGAHESRIEEDYWIEAIEWMDSLGVRLVSTSLGYATEMDDPLENYKPFEMNGKTSKISIAAQIAVKEKGMFLVVSAGNEGRKVDWRTLTTPADAEGVVSVGAVYANYLKAGYSSIGYDSVSYLKPDVTTFSLTGTSFSAPAVAGFVACMMQKRPDLSSDSIKTLLFQSSHLYSFANNYCGNGVPNAELAIELLEGKKQIVKVKAIKVTGESVTITIDKADVFPIIAFYKKDNKFVDSQEEIKLLVINSLWKKLFFIKDKKHKITIRRKTGITFTTLQIGISVFEFEWI
jgi:hypothetical protein